MNQRKKAIEAILNYHNAHKNERMTDSKQVKDSIRALSASDRNFMLVTAKMSDVSDIYPVSNTISNKYTLADLVTAYRMYLKDSNN